VRPVVGEGGAPDLVYRSHRRVDCRVHAEGELGTRDVVVYGGRDAYHLDPALGEFVLRVVASVQDALARARRLGTVERLESAPQLYLLRMTPEKTPRESWQCAVRELGEELPVFPVLYDRDGAPHYPTGEVTVRFEANAIRSPRGDQSGWTSLFGESTTCVAAPPSAETV